ncbi:glycosyltransferase family 4 protein [Natroniella acetigena]|uniref:glycosyltransferase family 4 protein n=1 Tax=Natroniella acetigena TaxID=52004 RepID=UPI00200A7574|nr:glycosyltransferase family 4 protein [Natroniella acetigena]MCK8827687.1 glycosyltransferase family 4 protein [Natroniella acetigena]
MKICMFLIDNIYYDARVQKEAVSLIDDGHEVDLITLNEKEIEDKEVFLGITLKKISIITRGFPKNIFFWVLKYFEFIIKSLFLGFAKDYDVYHCHDLPTLFMGVLIAKIKGKKVIYDSHEIYTEMTGAKLKKVWRLIERLFAKYADVTILTDEYRKEIFESMYPKVSNSKIIMNVPELQKNNSKCSRDLSVEVKLKENEILGIYFGTLLPKRFLEEIILSLKYLPDYIKIALVGPVNENYKKRLEKIISDNKLQEQVFILKPIRRNNLINYVSKADFSFVFYSKNNINNKYCSPNKLFESLHAGLPMITSDNPLILDVLDKSFVGIAIKNEIINSKLIAKSILKLIKEHNIRRMKSNCEKLSKEYSWNLEEKKLISIYKQLYKT